MGIVIQWQTTQTYCIGVLEAAENAPVMLLNVNSANTEWIFDRTTGLISLGSDPSLYLTVMGSIEESTPLCLAPLLEIGITQQWDWQSQPPLILLASNQGYCIDNRNGTIDAAPGNPIQIYTIITPTPGPNQQWLLLPAE